MCLFGERLYFCILESSPLTELWDPWGSSQTQPTRWRVLFLSQADTGIDHLHRENIRCHSIQWDPQEGAVPAGHQSRGRLLLGLCTSQQLMQRGHCNPTQKCQCPQSFRRCPAFPQWEVGGPCNIYTVKWGVSQGHKVKIHSLGIKTCGPAFPVTALKPSTTRRGRRREGGPVNFQQAGGCRQDVSSQNTILQARE